MSTKRKKALWFEYDCDRKEWVGFKREIAQNAKRLNHASMDTMTLNG